MGILTTLPLFWSLPTAFLAGTGAAAGIAMINSLGNLAGFLRPYLGRLAEAGDRGERKRACICWRRSWCSVGCWRSSVPAKMVNR